MKKPGPTGDLAFFFEGESLFPPFSRHPELQKMKARLLPEGIRVRLPEESLHEPPLWPFGGGRNPLSDESSWRILEGAGYSSYIPGQEQDCLLPRFQTLTRPGGK